jgi:hypothetical protein
MDLTALLQIGPFQTSYLELIAVAFGLICVWFMKKESLLAFPFGIVNVLIYVYIFFVARLYANAAINGFFFLMSVYGWYNWTRKDSNDTAIRITRCSKPELLLNLIAMILFFFHYPDGAGPVYGKPGPWLGCDDHCSVYCSSVDAFQKKNRELGPLDFSRYRHDRTLCLARPLL